MNINHILEEKFKAIDVRYENLKEKLENQEKRMLPSRFYGTANCIKPIPGDGSLSNDDSLSDSDDDVPLSRLRNQTRKKPIIIPPSDTDTSDDEIADPRPKALKQKRAVKEKKLSGQKEKCQLM
ncbi:unnamed protein product [Euphydryas editha]|uniref:Uncharacterized protein n=1 Tax=Euphydryas editha TaxID=104508 RepID=A0AAU9USU9_EUPED|nr:unnamed protein product [Euphydryas editha]